MGGYSSNALQAFSSTDLIFFFCLFSKTFRDIFVYDFSWWRCSQREAQSSLVALQVFFFVLFFFTLLFSLEGIETELGLLTAGNVGVWFRLRAGNDDSCSFNERPSKKKERQDRYGTRETQRASSTPVQIHVKKEKKKNNFVFLHQMKCQCIYSGFILPRIKPVTII